jgi:hypothetical protein
LQRIDSQLILTAIFLRLSASTPKIVLSAPHPVGWGKEKKVYTAYMLLGGMPRIPLPGLPALLSQFVAASMFALA